MGRGPAIWSDEAVELLKKHFVAVSLDAMAARGRRDAAADFLMNSGCIGLRSTGYVSVVSADGERFSRTTCPNKFRLRDKGMYDWLQARYEEWLALPEARRRAGAIKIPDLEQIDPHFATVQPPKGGLVLRVNNRVMQRSADGSPRYLRKSDLDETGQQDWERLREPANDFMWITQQEWRAMIPDDPQVGGRRPAPDAVTLRLLRHHLNPNLGITGGQAFTRASLEAGQLTVIVDKVTKDSVRLRLEGFADLQQPGGLETTLRYRPALLGHVTYDSKRDAVTEFEMVAFGELSGRIGFRPRHFFEKPRLLGVAFELIPNPTGAERLRPVGARLHHQRSRALLNYHKYVNPLSK